jgi:hypothetical protein
MINFADKRRSLCRYSSLADSGRGKREREREKEMLHHIELKYWEHKFDGVNKYSFYILISLYVSISLNATPCSSFHIPEDRTIHNHRCESL